MKTLGAVDRVVSEGYYEDPKEGDLLFEPFSSLCVAIPVPFNCVKQCCIFISLLYTETLLATGSGRSLTIVFSLGDFYSGCLLSLALSSSDISIMPRVFHGVVRVLEID
jgi:hypothetical protein